MNPTVRAPSARVRQDRMQGASQARSGLRTCYDCALPKRRFHMRNLLFAIVVVAALPAAGFAQPTDACPECMIGLWVGAFSANFTSDTSLPMNVNVGYWSSAGAPVQAVEFSVSNLENFLVQ